MPVVRKTISKAAMGEREKALRSELARLVNRCGLVKGSLYVRHRVCGRPNCRCTRGEKHAGLYLYHRDGRTVRQLHVGADREVRVRQWVGNYRRIQALLDELSRLGWQRLGEASD